MANQPKHDNHHSSSHIMMGNFRLYFSQIFGEHLKMWSLAVIIGLLGGGGAILMRFLISKLINILYGASGEHTIVEASAKLDWWYICAILMTGGAIIGLILSKFANNGRTESVANVIASSRLHHGEMSFKNGIVSALVSVLSIGFGASTGREGPAVHFGATLAYSFSRYFTITKIQQRILMASGVAAAVSASFNTPIAGALFAMEIILGYYAVQAFAPIVIASVSGAVLCRIIVGDYPAFSIPDHDLSTFLELPAFAILGIISALVSTCFMISIIWCDKRIENLRKRYIYPRFLEPVLGGLILGLLVIHTPEVLGLGYEATDNVLNEKYAFGAIIIIIIVKIIASSVSLASRFGGGVFAPSLMMGALTGGAFGIIISNMFPGFDVSYGLYALAGMGAVSAAALGAPISTTLIVFELTGDYQTALAVMVTVSVSTALTQKLIERSYFLWRLSMNGINLGDGPHQYVLYNINAEQIMSYQGSENDLSEDQSAELIRQGVFFDKETRLAEILKYFETTKLDIIPVTELTLSEERILIGFITHLDVLRTYNHYLIDAHKEEHN